VQARKKLFHAIVSLEDPKIDDLFVGIAASSTACIATLQRRSSQLCCNLTLTSDHVLADSPACIRTDLSGNNLPAVLGTQGLACGQKNDACSIRVRPLQLEIPRARLTLLLLTPLLVPASLRC